MSHRIACSVIAALALTVPACSGKPPSAPVEVLATGSYSLRSINGLAVPVTVSLRTGFKLEITSATFTIESSTRFTNSASYRRTENGVVTTPTDNCSGTYTMTNRAVAFSEAASGTSLCGIRQDESGSGGVQRNYTGTWDGANRLVVDFDPTTRSIYEK